ncbi:MAG: bifunctional pyr operon transcriptional regulator/uracil phosphoribosyltransferase PyrR [Bacteroidota bacterium]
MRRKLILDSDLLDITVNRLCQQLIEVHGDFSNSVIIGMQPRGIFLAEMIHKICEESADRKIDFGHLDTTFYRDDFRRRPSPAKANTTSIPFLIEDKDVILIDDVLYTGRSVRAALDAMITFGRPRTVELLVLVNRKYSRHLPVAPDYIGKNVNTIESQKVLVELEAQGHKNNKIWLVNKEA